MGKWRDILRAKPGQNWVQDEDSPKVVRLLNQEAIEAAGRIKEYAEIHEPELLKFMQGQIEPKE